MSQTVGVHALKRAMDWVIPADTTPGARSDFLVRKLDDLVLDLGPVVENAYAQELPRLTEHDLADPAHAFAPMFVDHVRDLYYAFHETGSWEDIGFGGPA